MSCCMPATMPCARFVIAAMISVSTTVFACTLLLIKGFGDVALTSFATGIISSNITYWSSPPNYKDDKNPELQPINGGPNHL